MSWLIRRPFLSDYPPLDTSKQAGDAEHIKVFATTVAVEKWFVENDPEGEAFAYEVRTE